MNALNLKLSTRMVTAIAVIVAVPASAQVPVDESGAPLANYESFEPDAAAGNEDIPLLTQTELQELVGPIALYPDDLLAIVLPASTYPLQLVQAQRFLDDLEQDPSLKPDDAWDDSVVALLNYPEVLDLLNEDLDWTWRLGEAVVAQQTDVVDAVEDFRDRAYAAGNLKSDSHQSVARNDGNIEITPVEDDIIYVPYYEPERVVVYQSRPVYHYYPRAYPVYYYPYPVGHAFTSGFFWGVTTAFTVGWVTDSVHVIHHSYHGHPYYGRHYWDGWWYRRPTIHVHNHYYSNSRYSVSRYRYSRGDHWRPRYETRRRLHNHRVTHSNYYTGRSVRHRSYTASTRHVNDRRLERTQSARSTSDRRRDYRTQNVRDSRRHDRQPAVASTTRQAPRRVTRPERNSEKRQRLHAQRELRRPDTVAKRDRSSSERRDSHRATERRQERRDSHRATERRQERRDSHRATERRQERRADPPRRQEPSRSRQRSKENDSARGKERQRHASARGDTRRRQRH